MVDDADVAGLKLLSITKVLRLAGRCSDHKKGISPLQHRLGAVFGPSALAAFPSRPEGRSSAGDCGDVAQENFAAHPRHYAASANTLPKSSVVDRG